MLVFNGKGHKGDVLFPFVFLLNQPRWIFEMQLNLSSDGAGDCWAPRSIFCSRVSSCFAHKTGQKSKKKKKKSRWLVGLARVVIYAWEKPVSASKLKLIQAMSSLDQ